MNSRFYFFEAGFRTSTTWRTLRDRLADVCDKNGGHLTLERSNADLLRGTFREADERRITVLSQDGAPEVLKVPTFLSCEFYLNKSKGLLLVKNPSRGMTRALISRLEDATNFQIYVEPLNWNLWDSLVSLEERDPSPVVLKIEIADLAFPNNLSGNLTLSGEITPERLNRYRKGALVRVYGLQHREGTARFALHSNGVIKLSSDVGFEEALSFQ